MALWGKKESISSLGTCAIDVSTKVLTTSGNKLISGGVAPGDVCTIGAGATYGYAIVKEVTGASTLTLVGLENLVSPHNTTGGTDVPALTALQISEEPMYNLNNAGGIYYAPESKSTGFSTSPVISGMYGVSVAEQEETVDDSSQYHPAHAGWVGITSYFDQHGNLRVKTETFVASSTITDDATGDFDDDPILPDS